MANVNKIVRRRQLALFIALVLGIGAGGAGTWMVSEMNLKKAPPAKAPKGEPAPDMTGVVNQSFDNKVQRSAIAEAQRLNKETQAEIKKLRTEMGIALLNARHGDVMMFSGVILTLTVLFCVHGLVPASGRRLQAGRWFAPAYAIHLFFIGFLVRVL